MKKKVLVYPCGTEIGLEIYRAVKNSIHYELIGGSCSYDHGRFVYEKHIDNLPFITDSSGIEEIKEFNKMIKAHNIDYIFPAMDGVLFKFAELREYFDCNIIAPSLETTKITRSKKLTYNLFQGVLTVPKMYDMYDSSLEFPLFIKPDVGQGSRGAVKINSREELDYHLEKGKSKDHLLLEYLPGEEYTIDCFTNSNGDLVYVGGRGRNRVKNGISVNAVREDDLEFQRIAEIINSRLNQRGGWFFQLKKNSNGEYSLLEVASRIAGTSAYTRNLGVNLPLLTLHLYNGNKIDSIIINDYSLELDRALYNKFTSNITYNRVYLDYDDTLIVNGKVNTQLIAFLYQCINEGVPITLLTRHKGSLTEHLNDNRLLNIFDEIVHLEPEEAKSSYVRERRSIFIDDSYGERAEVKEKLGIHVFDTHMIECLLKEVG
nr:ATP-grasp domain-containing protein [Fredinandcohnia onubensis]